MIADLFGFFRGDVPAEPVDRERKVKEAYPYRFNFALALVAIVGAGGIAAGLIGMALSVDDPRVRTREVPAAGLTASSSVADARSRYEGAPQTVPGEQVGPNFQGATCDVYTLADGLTLICHA